MANPKTITELFESLAIETTNGPCQCGCGGLAPIAKQKQRGYAKGQPQRFISGHNRRRGEYKDRYRSLRAPGHPHADVNGKVREHVVIAARALGRALPPGAEVHHVDGNGHNNANSNLVICQDRAYHMLLHARTRVVKAGGNPNTQRMCGYCHLPKDLAEFARNRTSSDGLKRICRACEAIYNREYRQRGGSIMTVIERVRQQIVRHVTERGLSLDE